MSDKPIEEKVKEIIVEQLGVNPEQVTPTASFIEDLGADSLDIVELTANRRRCHQIHRRQIFQAVTDAPPGAINFQKARLRPRFFFVATPLCRRTKALIGCEAYLRRQSAVATS